MNPQLNQPIGDRVAARLPRRRLGKSNLTVPALALGGASIGSQNVSDAEAIETVRLALTQGIDYFDTSPLYGESERRFGLALEGVDRDSLVISTKTGTHPDRQGDYSWDGTMWSVENSLHMLKTDYLDLVLVHDPNRYSDDGMAPIFAEGGALEALEHLKTQGVIRSIGLGQKRFDYHRQAIESDRFDVILTFNNYHPLDTSAADWLLPLAKQHDVGVLNGSPMAHGLMTGRDPDLVVAEHPWLSGSEMLHDVRRLYQWC
jgi:aryl-alcohol dehydrogenase-like predicted oxidoreductase